MTLDELRALRDVHGWSTARIAADVCAGRDGETIGDYLSRASEDDLPQGFRRWLARARVQLIDGEVHVIVTPAPDRRGNPNWRRLA